jgi:hypothetical protein
MMGKKFLLTLFCASLLSLPAWGQEAAEVWAGAYESSPANTDAFSAGAAKIRATRTHVSDRAEVEHIWGDQGDTTDDNGLHRMGSGRCFMQDAEPTVLSDSITDHDNTGGAGQGDLNDGSTNSAGAAANDDVGAGRCWIDTNDNNKMYIYVGVAGDGNGSWVELEANRVKAGGGRNILFNGDFEYNATDSAACDSTTDPTGWTDSGTATATYEVGSTNQGVGCALVQAGGALSDFTQVLSNLKGSTTYRVTAQVKEAVADDVCTLSTSDAATDVTGMVSAGVTYTQLDGFFITSAALDEVTLKLEITDASDVCTWDHIAVYREENTEVPEAGIVAVYDTYVTVGVDGADVEEEGTGYADVPDLSIAFTPPTENWTLDIKANISLGCTGDCGLDDTEGAICRIEKGGAEIAGTVRAYTPRDTNGSVMTNIFMDTIEINPAAGTALVYTVACKEIGTNDIVYNPIIATPNDTESSLSMIAFPPH